jgi:hypothetical protein
MVVLQRREGENEFFLCLFSTMDIRGREQCVVIVE